MDRSMERTMENRGMSRSPAASHMMSQSPGLDHMSRSPNPMSMSRSPGHVSMGRSPGAGYMAHMDRSTSPNPVMPRSPVPADYRSVSPHLGYETRSMSPKPGYDITSGSGFASEYRSQSPIPDYVSPSRSRVPHVMRAPAPPINTSFDLSSDDEYSPIQSSSPSFRPPLSPQLALSSDDEEMMTIGEIKSAMAREEAALPTVGELRSNHSSRSGTPTHSAHSGSQNGSVSSTSYNGPVSDFRTRGSVSSVSTTSSSRSSTPVSASTPTSRANRTWANTSRFSLAERRDSMRQERPSSRMSEKSHDESVYSSSRDLNSSSFSFKDRLNTSNGLSSSTSSISTFGYDSVGSNVSRGSFRYDMCAARPGSRVSCYDEDFGNVTVETVREESERSFQEGDMSHDQIRDLRMTAFPHSRDYTRDPSRPDVLDDPSINLPTGDPHKLRDPQSPTHDSTHVKSLPHHVTPCAPPQPSYMSQSVSSTRPRCIVCDDHVAMNERIVQTESLSGSRDIYHLRCFRCCICDSSLEHMEHYIDPHSDMLFCHVDYHETFSPKCAQCSSCIEGDYVQAMGKTYHVDHFFCAQCGKPFQEGQQHHIIEGHAYCSPCYDVKTAEKCWRCSHVFNVNDPIIEVLDRLWCEACYSCEECGVGLKEEFTLTNEGVVLCEKCQVKKVKRYAWQ
ncbi:hypothetical protein BKA91DRAFT_136961 [Yarrowia lipolytica]|nr:hypothetical protein BKA91DRAFT_136961 [Yarrowia lipolytica]KAE8174091.1 hypothetical protein BKA90DRAFT_134381 [Yarrowia lipolytica]RMI95536.1 hypothetical protein BD777DRAFT_129943 [Yarrowia lipolytica]